MPLAFDCLSHGTIAFGFFNIDSDMLLLQHYFFFATGFCDQVSRMAERTAGEAHEDMWQVFHIPREEDIGDLMGAIHGVRHTGFIGEVYRRYPFPKDPEAFKQKPEGFRTQEVIADMIRKCARPARIPLCMDAAGQEVGIGEFRFNRDGFQELVQYVWQGGYPRWKNEERPDYVLNMKTAVLESGHGVFEGMRMDGGRTKSAEQGGEF